MPQERPDVQAPSATATAEQVVDALFERHSSKALVKNQRRQQRLRWVAKVTIWLRRDRWDFPREVEVTTLDISRGGFSFMYPHFLHTDTTVSTRFDTLPDRPILTGTIKSCVYVAGQHRVGVEFISSAPDRPPTRSAT